MVSRLKTYLMHIPVLAGVEIEVGLDGTLLIHATLLEQQKGTVQPVRGEYELTSIAALRAFLPDKVPVAVCLAGKAVLHKISPAEATGQATVPSAVAPQSADLVHQTAGTGGAAISSRMRGSLFADVMTALQAEGIEVLAVSLGPFAALHFLDQLAQDGQPIRFGAHELQCSATGVLTSYRWTDGQARPSAPPFTFAGTAMNHRAFPAFITAFAVMIGAEIPMPEQPEYQGRVSEYRYRRCFWRTAKAIAAAVLLLLLVNTGVYLSYAEAPAGEAGSGALPAVSRHELDSLRQLLGARDTLMSGLGVRPGSAGPAKAYLADQLAASLPPPITLTSLAFNPADEARSRRSRKPVVTPQAIRITGSCKELPQVTQWIDQLRSFTFCRDVQLVRYLFNTRTATGDFELTLILRN